MAFGFPAYHEASVAVSGEASDRRDAVIAASEDLGWIVRETSDDMMSARVRWGGGASTGERITVSGLSDGNVLVRSECLYRTQCIDWGRNKANVERLVAHLRQLFVTTEG